MTASASDERPPRKPARAELRRLVSAFVTSVVTAVVLMLVCGGVGRWLLRPHRQSPRPQTRCANRLRQLGGILTSESMEHGDPESGGVPLLIEYYRRGFVQRGRESVFTCPEDPDVEVPRAEAFSTVDVTDAAALGRLCSYAVRDFARFPLDSDAVHAEWIMCDRMGLDGRTPHHINGINVLFSDGAVQFKDREALGLSPDEAIVIGPTSMHPEARKMVIVPEAPR